MSLLKLEETNLIIKAAPPLMATFLAQKGMQLVDTMMMGWIGPQALAAGALGTSLFTTVLIFCMGTLSSVGIFIARARGARQDSEVSLTFQQGIILALILSIPSMFMLWNAPLLLTYTGESAQVIQNVQLLLHGLVWGFPGFLLFLVCRELISAFTLTRIVMLVTLCSIPLTFIANYLLIYGKYGLPHLGIAGIGYAGATIMWFMFLCLFFYAKNNTTLKIFLPKTFLHIDRHKISEMFKLGVPSGLLLVLDMGLFLSAAILMGHFGVDALAAHQIAMQCATLAYAVPFGLSMATALLIGHAVGENNFAKAKRITYISLTIGIFIAGLIALVFAFFPQDLTRLFLANQASNINTITTVASSLLGVAAIFQCFDAVQTILNGALKGLKDTLVPMLLCITCYWAIGVGSAYYLAFHTHYAAKGIWYGLTLGICSASIVLALRFFTRIKHNQI